MDGGGLDWGGGGPDIWDYCFKLSQNLGRSTYTSPLVKP